MTEYRRQKGVLIFLTPFLFVALAVIVTLAMDVARIYAIRADMQRIVNAAATAAADEAQACGAGELQAMRSRALVAARRMGFEGSDDELEVMAGVLAPDPDNTDVLRFTPTPVEQSNATVVRYTRQEPVSWLLPESLVAPIELSVNAAARKELYAVLSANASTLTIHDGLLGNLLGALFGQSDYRLDPTSLASLENTLIGVGTLLDRLGVDEVTDLLGEPLIRVLDAVVDIVGGVTTPVGALVDDLTRAVGISGLDAEAVLRLVGDPEAAKQAEFPLYDLVMSVVANSLRELNQGGAGLLKLDINPSDSPLLGALLDDSLLGDLDVSVSLSVDNPAPVVIGPARRDENGDWMTELYATDITLEVLIDLELALGNLGLVKALDNVRIPLVVQVGGGKATFTGARCARGPDNTVDLEVLAQPAVASVETGTLQPDGYVDRESIYARILKISELLEVCLQADVGAYLPVADKQQQVMDFPLYCPDQQCTETFSGGGPTWVEGLDVEIENFSLFDCEGQTLLGGLLDALGVSDLLMGLLKPLLQSLLNLVTTVVLKAVVSPLLTILGVDLDGLEVILVGADQLGSQVIENVQL